MNAHECSCGGCYPRYRWVILLVSLMAIFCSGVGMFCIGAVLTEIIREFKLSGALAGSLTAIYCLPGVFFTFIGGVIADKYGRKSVGVMSLSIMAVGAVVMAFSRNYVELAIARFLMGVGASLTPPSFIAVLPEWFPQNQHGLILGCPVAAYNMAAFTAFAASALAPLYGWRTYIWCVAVIPPLIGLILSTIILRGRVGVAEREREDELQWRNVIRCIKNPDIVKATVYWMMMAGLYSTMGTWYPTFFAETMGWPLSFAALIVSVNAVTGIPSGPIGGKISDKMGSRKLVLWVSALTLVFAYTLPLIIRNLYLLIIDMILIGVFATLPNGPINALLVDMVGTSLAGTGIGIICLGASIGSTWSPIIFGTLKDATKAWNYSFHTLGIMGLIAFTSATLIKEEKKRT